MSRHECKYWKYNLKHHYRWCDYCRKKQYNYGGVWKDEIKGLYWLGDFMTRGGTDFRPQIEIQVGYPFEWSTIENWNVVFTIKIDGKEYGPFVNFNNAEHVLAGVLGEKHGN